MPAPAEVGPIGSGPAGPAAAAGIARLNEEVIACRACPRLVAWREEVARNKRASFADQEYWGRPVTGFGDPGAWLGIVGLAPAAHGANRTGRMFTGDRSGDWLYRALHRAGLANQSDASDRSDGLELIGAYVTAVVRCAPPANKPKPDERDRCLPFLARELGLLSRVRVIVSLGGFSYGNLCRLLTREGMTLPRPRPKFTHGLEVPLDDGRWLLCSYHPSQQNTFTGTLTEEMFDRIWTRAKQLGH